MKQQYKRWAILWPGNPDYLMTTLYRTREEARQDERMRMFNAMIRTRKDLRSPPLEWKTRRPVKVLVTVETI